MKRTYEVSLSANGIAQLKNGLKEYEKWLGEKCGVLCERLAELGVKKATAYFKVPYDGANDLDVTWESRGGNEVAVVATGSVVLFLEFGAGALMGYGHPDPMGFGPGTYNPDSNKWQSPSGWIYQHDKPRSYGNPPSAAMYNAHKEVKMEIANVAREVFDL